MNNHTHESRMAVFQKAAYYNESVELKKLNSIYFNSFVYAAIWSKLKTNILKNPGSFLSKIF